MPGVLERRRIVHTDSNQNKTDGRRASSRTGLLHATSTPYRAAAVSQVLTKIGTCLKALWGKAIGALFDALEARSARCHLRYMDDHMLKDIGIRRDQIGCISKRIPW
jgi:uncharacterized protein YjiS (DUF1127 family)